MVILQNQGPYVRPALQFGLWFFLSHAWVYPSSVYDTVGFGAAMRPGTQKSRMRQAGMRVFYKVPPVIPSSILPTPHQQRVSLVGQTKENANDLTCWFKPMAPTWPNSANGRHDMCESGCLPIV